MWPRPNPKADKRKSEAYLVNSEWGPDRLIPRPERLAGMFPDTDETTRVDWMTDFDRVEREIWRFAEEGGPRLQSIEAFRKRMTAAFPFMNDDALGRAWSLAVYYTVHEGY